MLIIAGIPPSVSNRVNRDKTKSVSDLIAKINQLDGGTPRQNNIMRASNKNYFFFSNSNFLTQGRNSNYKHCMFFAKIGKPGRFHPESQCKTKLNSNFKFNTNSSKHENIKIVNNTELEDLLNKEADSKN